MGRHKVGGCRINISFTEEQKKYLEQLAIAEGQTISAIVRNMVNEHKRLESNMQELVDQAQELNMGYE